MIIRLMCLMCLMHLFDSRTNNEFNNRISTHFNLYPPPISPPQLLTSTNLNNPSLKRTSNNKPSNNSTRWTVRVAKQPQQPMPMSPPRSDVIRHRCPIPTTWPAVHIGDVFRRGPSFASTTSIRESSSRGRWTTSAMSMRKSLATRFTLIRKRQPLRRPTPGVMWATSRPCCCRWPSHSPNSRKGNAITLRCALSMSTLVMECLVFHELGNSGNPTKSNAYLDLRLGASAGLSIRSKCCDCVCSHNVYISRC